MTDAAAIVEHAVVERHAKKAIACSTLVMVSNAETMDVVGTVENAPICNSAPKLFAPVNSWRAVPIAVRRTKSVTIASVAASPALKRSAVPTVVADPAAIVLSGRTRSALLRACATACRHAKARRVATTAAAAPAGNALIGRIRSASRMERAIARRIARGRIAAEMVVEARAGHAAVGRPALTELVYSTDVMVCNAARTVAVDSAENATSWKSVPRVSVYASS